MAAPQFAAGFIGLGNMGGPMAANLAKRVSELAVYDAAGTAERAPDGASVAHSTAAVAAAAETVFLSLPDGKVVAAVAEQILAANNRRTTQVVDLSTVGIEAAQAVAARLSGAGIAYLDAPVSGGVSGARAGTVAVMFAGPAEAYAALQPLLAAIGKPFHVGERPGQGQAMKIANNFLSATAMAATSEAVAFGVGQGLDMGMMLEVLNASSGQNTATSDKFPRRVLTESYDAGFTNTLLSKDVTLYHQAARQAKAPVAVGGVVERLWRQFRDAAPGVDFTRIYPFVRDGGEEGGR